MLFDGPGRSIWAGRDERNATIAQWRALIARDRGCVGCGADPNRCEAHHILEWDNWGPTNIDNLVLVCTRCHHDIHHRGARLRRTDGRWHIDAPNSPPR
ncbi:MAG: HNH endonuclease signature motif containing protein [Acidimicrobiales bacterium]